MEEILEEPNEGTNHIMISICPLTLQNGPQNEPSSAVERSKQLITLKLDI